MGRREAARLGLPCLILAALLGGCATVESDRTLDAGAPWLTLDGRALPSLALDQTQRQRMNDRRARLLAGPLDERGAVELAWQTSPAAQALLAEGWAAQAQTMQGVSLPRLGIALERIVHGDEIALARTLSLGLTEWLALPARREAAQQQIRVQSLQVARDLLALEQTARRQWVRAVAAAQSMAYQEQVRDAAEAGAELARRMQAVGNFSRLQRAREQAVLTDAQAQLARAALQARVEREALIRVLGLPPESAERLRLPSRLPDVPARALSAEQVAAAAQRDRIDVAWATAQWRAAGGDRERRWTGFLDAELKLSREREGVSRSRGTEVDLMLPSPDRLASESQHLSARALAAEKRLEQTQVEAASVLRERYAVYRTAHELARQAHEEWVPLHKAITDETLLRYNGMLVGVFELLAQARQQVSAVAAAMEAQRDFWLAQIALDGAIVGAPGDETMPQRSSSPSAATSGGH